MPVTTTRIASDPLVALYASARATQPCAHVPLSEVYRRIRAGAWSQSVAHVRRCRVQLDAATDPAERTAAEQAWQVAKAHLPAITLSGDATTRERSVTLTDRGITPTSRVQIDLDLHGEAMTQYERLRALLMASPHIEALWRSPSGDGLKATVVIAGAGDPARHADAFTAVDRWLLTTIGRTNDPQVKDSQRLCFVSHDPELFVNQQAVPLERDLEPPIATLPALADVADESATPASIPTPPDTVASASAAASIVADAGTIIPSGQRNAALARHAGWMRRSGMSAAEITAGLLAINVQRCQPPLAADEVHRIAASIARYEPDQVTMATVEHWAAETLSGPAPHAPPSVAALVQAKPSLRPPLIDGLLRLGETMNVIAAPKVGKSWLVTDLALAVATGQSWLGHGTQQQDVLILDNELHGETSAHRIPKVAAARGCALDDYGSRICIENLRGRLTDLFSMAAYFDAIPVGRYGLIVLDAFYRFLPAGTDENDNGTMASLYNAIDRHAERLGCCFALIHHSSKGNQSGKAVTDVGSGAGAQSRATDTHLVLRPHEEPDAVVLDAAVRSWPPITAQVLRWHFPLWIPAPDLDPTRLRKERPRRERSSASAIASAPTLDLDAFVADVLATEPLTRPALIARGRQAGWSQRRLEQMLTLAEQQGLAHRWTFGPIRAHAFASVAQTPSGREGAHALPPHPPGVRTPLEGVAQEPDDSRVPPGPDTITDATCATEVAHV